MVLGSFEVFDTDVLTNGPQVWVLVVLAPQMQKKQALLVLILWAVLKGPTTQPLSQSLKKCVLKCILWSLNEFLLGCKKKCKVVQPTFMCRF